MELRIPQEIIDSTVCDNQYGCISNDGKCGRGPICDAFFTISGSDGKASLCVAPYPENDCKHNERYGCWEVCHCPVRVYIYKEYNL